MPRSRRRTLARCAEPSVARYESHVCPASGMTRADAVGRGRRDPSIGRRAARPAARPATPPGGGRAAASSAASSRNRAMARIASVFAADRARSDRDSRSRRGRCRGTRARENQGSGVRCHPASGAMAISSCPVTNGDDASASAAPLRCVHHACSHSHVRNGPSAVLARSSAFHCGRSAVNPQAVSIALHPNRVGGLSHAAARTAWVNVGHHATSLSRQAAETSARHVRDVPWRQVLVNRQLQDVRAQEPRVRPHLVARFHALVPELERVDAALLQRARPRRPCRARRSGRTADRRRRAGREDARDGCDRAGRRAAGSSRRAGAGCRRSRADRADAPTRPTSPDRLRPG